MNQPLPSSPDAENFLAKWVYEQLALLRDQTLGPALRMPEYTFDVYDALQPSLEWRQARRCCGCSKENRRPQRILSCNALGRRFVFRRNGTILQFDFSDAARKQLDAAGIIHQRIPGGPKSPNFLGDELIIKPDQFDLFNKLLDSGDISIIPAKF